MKELETIVPFMWLVPRKNEIKAKISGIIPAGSDSAYPYTRLKIELENGDQLVLKESLVRLLFDDAEVLGTFKETYDESVIRLELNKPKVENENVVKIAKAKKEV